MAEEPSGTVSVSGARDGADGGTMLQGKVSYGVQIFALSRVVENGDPALKGVRCTRYKSGRLYRYVAGECGTQKEAEGLLREIKAKFPDAYLVKVEDGKVAAVK